MSVTHRKTHKRTLESGVGASVGASSSADFLYLIFQTLFQSRQTQHKCGPIKVREVIPAYHQQDIDGC